MTEYTNTTNTNPTGNGLGEKRNVSEHQKRIAYICIEAFAGLKDLQEFKEFIQLMKPLCLWQSKTPTLDSAYFDGFTAALSIIKQESGRKA